MQIDILTLFPRMFEGPLSESLIGKARERGLLNVRIVDIRDFTADRHKQTDDSPYGGGAGMVLKPEPIAGAVESLRAEDRGKRAKIILMSPSGKLLDHQKALELSKEESLVIICGHYEGVDERIIEKFSPEEISIGDYVLTGGELPAMVLVDTVVRQIPGVIKEEESVMRDSFFNGLLDYPSFTRPEEWQGLKVPEVLLSGNHKDIEKFRRKESLKRTFFRRPDLLSKVELSGEDRSLLKEIVEEG